MITPQDMQVIDRVFDDIREALPIKKNPIGLVEKISNTYHEEVWETLNTLQQVYNAEVDRNLDELSGLYQEIRPEQDEVGVGNG